MFFPHAAFGVFKILSCNLDDVFDIYTTLYGPQIIALDVSLFESERSGSYVCKTRVADSIMDGKITPLNSLIHTHISIPSPPLPSPV